MAHDHCAGDGHIVGRQALELPGYLCASRIPPVQPATVLGMAGLHPERMRMLQMHAKFSTSSAPLAPCAAKVLEMATFTLQRMAAGGMRDQLGGGFHRYSVDEHWHVPHFEVSVLCDCRTVGSLLRYSVDEHWHVPHFEASIVSRLQLAGSVLLPHVPSQAAAPAWRGITCRLYDGGTAPAIHHHVARL